MRSWQAALVATALATLMISENVMTDTAVMSDRFHHPDVFGAIVLDRIDALRYRNTDKLGMDLIGEDFLDLFDVLVQIQPRSIGFGFQNDRHPVMNLDDGFAGIPGQDRAGAIWGFCLAFVIPTFPKAGKCKGASTRQRQEHGLFVVFLLLPLVKAIGDDQASALPEGRPEAGFVGGGFPSGVDHPAADGSVLGPIWNQTPEKFFEVIFPVVPYDGIHLLGGRDIVIGIHLGVDDVDRKILDDCLKSAESNESAAHVEPHSPIRIGAQNQPKN